MDVEPLPELAAEAFRLRRQIEAYRRLQAEEIEELRVRLRNLEERLSQAMEAASAGGCYAEGAPDDEGSRPSL